MGLHDRIKGGETGNGQPQDGEQQQNSPLTRPVLAEEPTPTAS
jgi:hypothetical protein